MAVQDAGVRLVAQDQAAFLAALAAANGAVQALGVGSATSAAQIDKLTGRIEFQQRTLGILAQELDATKAKYGEGSVQAQRKQLALDKLTASIAKDEAALAQLQAQESGAAQSSAQLAQGFDNAGKASRSFGEVMTGALRKVGELAVSALASAAAALGSFVASSIKGAGDYEQAMNVLQSTSGATNEQMQAVKDTAKALGADLTLPATSAASAGNAMLYLTQQGLSLNDAMKAAKGTLQLAAAGMIDEKVAAETTATALNQFHLAGSEATKVADLLAASVSASGSSVAQTGQAVQQAGTSFASAHVPLLDFVTLINEMSQAGIKGSDAGTSLKTMMQRLEAPTKAAKEAMANLGISVYDSQGAMRPMRDIIGQFDGSLKGLTQQQRDQAIVTIFGSDAQRAANIVLAGGTDAYDKMRAAVDKNGAAASLAGAQMKGLNGAVAGLGSQVETLALEALEPLLPIMTGIVMKAAEVAGSFVGQVGPAVTSLIGFFGQAGAVLNEVGIPALAGLTAALVTYAAVQVVQATPAILASLPAIAAQTAAFAANALAVLAAVAPYALIVAAVGAMTLAYQNFNEKNKAATDQLLATRQWWTDAGAAVADYGTQSGDAATKLQPLADNISYMRDLIHGEIESLAKRREAGLVNDQQMQDELATINQHSDGLKAATQAYNDQSHALAAAQAATMTATQATQDQSSALSENQGQIQLTEKDLQDLAKQLDATYKAGTQAVQDYVTQASGFMDDFQSQQADHQDRLTKLYKEKNDARTKDEREAVDARIAAENDGFAKQEAAAGLAYAKQAAAQRAHLGAMLSDYTLAQKNLGNITGDQADVILGAIEKQFGVADDTSARTFLHMEQAIDQFAKNGGTSADDLSKHLGTITDDAVKTKEKMDALAKKYTLEVQEDLDKHRITAEEYRKALDDIPRRVNITVHTTYTSSGSGGSGGGSGNVERQAAGGPVNANQTYMVGEKGPELFTTSRDGYIVPNHRISPPASAQQIINVPAPQIVVVQPASTQNYYGQVGNTYNGASRAEPSYRTLRALFGSRG